MESLTEHDKKLVQRSFTHIAPQNEDIAAVFYTRLFELNPDIEHLFSTGLDVQRAKLMRMMADLVNALDAPEALSQSMHELGKQHVSYGVHDKHYATVGEALIWALRKVCPAVMTPTVTQAWEKTYALFAELAISGAH